MKYSYCPVHLSVTLTKRDVKYPFCALMCSIDKNTWTVSILLQASHAKPECIKCLTAM